MNATKVITVMGVFESSLHDRSAPWHAFFDWAETRTGVRRLKLALGLVLVISMFLAVSFSMNTVVSNAIGLAYPLYRSLMLIGRPAGKAVRAERKRWLVYWVKFYAVYIFENYFMPFDPRTVPLYCPARTACLMWDRAPVGFRNVFHRSDDGHLSYGYD